MLVVKIEGNFIKKATGITVFACEDGLAVKKTIEDAIFSNDGKIITTKSYGRNAGGEVVADFAITWSFKVKSNIT